LAASALAVALAGPASAHGHHALAAQATRWVASLSGNQQVPPVASAASGSALFKPVDDGQALPYQVRGHAVAGTLEEQSHLGAPGTNGGEPVLDFLGVPAPGLSGEVDVQGVVSADQLIGPLAGHPLRDLLKQLSAGTAYINVHTVAHPEGEIRGNLSRL